MAATPLVVVSRPRYIMSSAPPRSPRQRVFPSLLPSVAPARLAFGAQPGTWKPRRGGTGAGLMLLIDGTARGGASGCGVPRWGATCRKHTWSEDVRPAEGPAPAPPR